MGSYDVVGSFPKSFGYGVEGADMEEGFSSDEKPRILLMGLRRSGKSSIQKVSGPGGAVSSAEGRGCCERRCTIPA